jgi:hypothetical protein
MITTPPIDRRWLPLGMLLLLAGCTYEPSTHRLYANACEKAADVLATVNDKDSAKASGSALQALADNVTELRKRPAGSGSPPTEHDVSDLKATRNRFNAERDRVLAIPGADTYLKEPLDTLSQ